MHIQCHLIWGDFRDKSVKIHVSKEPHNFKVIFYHQKYIFLRIEFLVVVFFWDINVNKWYVFLAVFVVSKWYKTCDQLDSWHATHVNKPSWGMAGVKNPSIHHRRRRPILRGMCWLHWNQPPWWQCGSAKLYWWHYWSHIHSWPQLCLALLVVH